MTSDYGDYDPLRGTKKRRLQGACDACRKRKIKCDRATRLTECTNCISFNILCTQDLGRGRRSKGLNSVHEKDYVCKLEERVKELEKQLPNYSAGLSDGDSPHSTPEAFSKSTSSPFFEFEPLISAIVEDEDHFFANTDAPTLRRTLVKLVYFMRSFREQSSSYLSYPEPQEPEPVPSSSRSKLVTTDMPYRFEMTTGKSATLEEQLKSEQDSEMENITAELDSLTVNTFDRRFYGRSSETTMINLAFQLQSEVLRARQPEQPDTRPGLPKRVQFWQAIRFAPDGFVASQPVLIFPEPDLLYSLIEVYFEQINRFVPTLHKPTFLALLAEGVHHEDIMFGGLVLAACALGAAAGSDDPRTLVPGAPLPNARGLGYMRQILRIRKPVIGSCSLYEIQMLCTLLHVHCAGEGIFSMIGSAIRSMQEMGVHRMNGTSTTSVEGELWRRALWTFICMDRISAGMTGRPCCVQDEDYDLEWPREVDDEYWQDPIHPWKQPLGKPSRIQFFTQFIKLCTIQGNGQRTIYANKKPRIFRHLKDEEWQRRVILELDSELNQFQAELPAHLRWDPENQDLDSLKQAGPLSMYFNFVRMKIHRPFILNQGNTKMSLPLLISTNAAHAICNTVHVLNQAGIIVNPLFQSVGFGAGVVILHNVWSCIRYNGLLDWTREIAFVDRLLEYLKTVEKRWCIAGRGWDVLNGLRWTPTGKIEHLIAREQPPSVKHPASSQQHLHQHNQHQPEGNYYRSSRSFSQEHAEERVSSSSNSSSNASRSGGPSYNPYPVSSPSNASSSAPSSAASPPGVFDGRNLAPLHFSQPAYFSESLPKADLLPSSFGGLDGSQVHTVNTPSWDLEAYNLTYPDYNQYSQHLGTHAEQHHHHPHHHHQHHQQEQEFGGYYDNRGWQQGCYVPRYEGFVDHP